MRKKEKAKGKQQTLSEDAKNTMYQEVDLSQYIEGDLTEKQKKKFADLAVDEIRSRTLQGFDVNGKKFKKYSKKYASMKGVGVNDVNLFLDGKMLNGIGRRKSKEKKSILYRIINNPEYIKQFF